MAVSALPVRPDPAVTTAGGDRLALVTGASRGLGLALREHLLRRGFRVIAMQRDAVGADSWQVDLSEPQRAVSTFDRALDELGQHSQLDLRSVRELIVVLNAATVEPIAAVARQALQDQCAAMQLNLLTPMALASRVLSRFADLPARKVLAHVTSGAASRIHEGLAVYSAAKAGMAQFIRVAATEQQRVPHPFLVVEMDPGALDTAMQDRLRGAATADLPSAQAFVQRHAQGTLMAADHAAALIVERLLCADLGQGECFRALDVRLKAES